MGTRINVTCFTVLSRAWAVVHHCSESTSCCSVTLPRKLAPEGQGWEPSARVGVLQVDGLMGTDRRGRRSRTESGALTRAGEGEKGEQQTEKAHRTRGKNVS